MSATRQFARRQGKHCTTAPSAMTALLTRWSRRARQLRRGPAAPSRAVPRHRTNGPMSRCFSTVVRRTRAAVLAPGEAGTPQGQQGKRGLGVQRRSGRPRLRQLRDWCQICAAAPGASETGPKFRTGGHRQAPTPEPRVTSTTPRMHGVVTARAVTASPAHRAPRTDPLTPSPPPALLILPAARPGAPGAPRAAAQPKQSPSPRRRRPARRPRVWERGGVDDTRCPLRVVPGGVLGRGGARAPSCQRVEERLLDRRVHAAQGVEAVGVSLDVGERSVGRTHLLPHKLGIARRLERLAEDVWVRKGVCDVRVGLEHAAHLRVVEDGAVQRGQHLRGLEHG
mmetsp:Transcript_5550/g.18406  ORF Transcript_5550/g.18406 Transcript_5550/m.18406 type:complete len:339 (+) Transcript_5550:465-1481(+)